MRGNIIRGHFEDVDELTEAGESWNAQLCPISALPGKEIAASFFLMADANVEYAYFEFAPALSMNAAPPSDAVTFNFMEPNDQRYWVRGHDLGTNSVWVFPTGSDFQSLAAPGFKVNTLSVPETSIERLAEILELWVPPKHKRSEYFTLPSSAMTQMRVLCRSLRSGEVMSLTKVAQDILRVLLPYWFLRSGVHARAQVGRSRRQIAVANCLNLLDSVDGCSLSNHDLAELCGVSERTLQYGFTDRFGKSLSAFVKLRRLTSARLALLQSHKADVKVGDLAGDHGFWHHGQFTKDYLKEFGERPSETLARSARY